MNWKLSKLFLGWLHEGRDVSVNYEKPSLFHDLTKSDSKTKLYKNIFPWHPAFSLLLVICEVILGLTLVLVGTIQMVRDDLLYTNQQTVNEQGCVSVKQSLGREYALFLFNTSDLWSETGIRLSKGDICRMSFSGAFHSSIGHLVADSENNNPQPSVKWTYCDSIRPQADFKKVFCIEPTAEIGNILYRIGYSIPRIDANVDTLQRVFHPIKICQNGTLQLAVNDIYFKDDSRLSQFAETIKNRRYTESDAVIGSFPSFIPNIDTVQFRADIILQKDTSLFADNYPRMLYDDNLGQILMCLEIEHPIEYACINPKAAFRDIEGKIRTYRYYDGPCTAFGKSLVSFTFWFLPKIFFIFAFWFVILFLALYILYWAGWWIAWSIRKLYKRITKHSSC